MLKDTARSAGNQVTSPSEGSSPGKKPVSIKAKTTYERRAAALRANLYKRKAQAQKRSVQNVDTSES